MAPPSAMLATLQHQDSGRFADRIAVLRRGRLAAAGTPRAVLTDSLVSDVFDCPLKVDTLPPQGVPFLLPQAAG